MRKAARAIIIHDDQLLVMHRNKFGTEYYALPGGKIEIGETPEQALVREIAEETSITFDRAKLVFIEHAGDMYGDQYIFLCDYQSGQPQLHPHSEEEHINRLGKNLYKPIWLSLADLPAVPFLSKELQQAILKGIQHGWPESTIEFASTRNV